MADRSFGEWLKHQRRARGWTQKELAIRVNCSISAIRKVESEDRFPSVQVVERLADIFGIPKSDRRDFMRFARGDWQAVPHQGLDDNLLRILHFDPRSYLPKSIMNLIDHNQVNGLLGLTWESPEVEKKLILLRRALEQSEATGDIRRRLESLWQLGWLDQSDRFSYWEKAIQLARVLGDSQALASGLSTIGFFLVLNGDLDKAQTYLAESNALYKQLQLQPIASHLLSAYGQISLIRGDFEKARAYLQEHARASLELGNRQDYLWSQVRLGYVTLRENNLPEAERIFREAVQEFRHDRNIIGVVFALEGTAELNIQMGNPLRAARLIGWADSTREKISDTRPQLEQADVEKTIAACVAAAGESAFSAAYEEGQKMTMEQAVEHVLEEHS